MAGPAELIDGQDQAAIAAAVTRAQKSNKPSLIACKTTIGYGAPTKAGTNKAHGDALGAEELKGAKENLGISLEPFSVPDDVVEGLAAKPAAMARRGGAQGMEVRGWRHCPTASTPNSTSPPRHGGRFAGESIQGPAGRCCWRRR